MRRFLRQVKDVIICFLTVIAMYTAFLSCAWIAEENKLALLTLLASVAWIYLFIKANREVLE